GAAGRWWNDRAAGAPAASTAMAFPPIEARLLAAAAREPANPHPYLDLAEEYAASARPASALWAYSEAASRPPGEAAIRLKVAATVRTLGYPGVAEGMLKSLAATQGTAAQARLDLADLLIST